MALNRNPRVSFIVSVLVSATGVCFAVDLPLTLHQASTSADGARCVRSADLDSDGDLDVLVAASDGNEFLWLENTSGTGSSWTSHTIRSDGFSEGANFIDATDIDGDGDLDVFGTSGTVDNVWWGENDGTPASGSWTYYWVDTAVDGPNWVEAGDMDRDGDMDLVGVLTSDGIVVWWENDDPTTNQWTDHVISSTFAGPWSATMVDLDDDGDLDVLATSLTENTIAWWESDGTPDDGGWTRHDVATAFTFAHGAVTADFDADGDIDIVGASFLDDTISWWENDGTPDDGGWVKQDLTTSFDGAYDVSAADVDGDGDPDILGAASFDNRITWWENDGTPDNGGWTEHVVTSVFGGASSVVAADVDGDGDSDILGAARTDDEITWWENTSIHSTASFPSAAGAIIDPAFSGEWPSSVAVGDLDSDGDLDVVAADPDSSDIVWWENDVGWPAHSVLQSSPRPGVVAVAVKDFDADGHPDIAVTFDTDPSVVWFRNDGTPASGPWSDYDVSIGGLPRGDVLAADIDHNGYPDLLAHGSDIPSCGWFLNDGTPANTSWESEGCGIASSSCECFPGLADFDRDGLPDVVTIADSASNLTLYWIRNIGREFPHLPYEWSNYPIATVSGHALGTGDLDGDGYADIVVLDTTSVSWWENDGTPIDGGWTERLIGAHPGSDEGTARAVDIDEDGDLDVVITASTAGDLMWWENDGTPVNGGWTQHVVDDDDQGVMALIAADLNNDGTLDLISGAENDENLAFLPNMGGQFALETTSMAPSAVVDSESAAVLSVIMTHLGRPGEHDEELATLELLFESASGVPMASSHANSRIDILLIYLDTGDGVWTDGVDTLVASTTNLSLAQGVQTMALLDASTHLQLSPGESKLYFVVITTTSNASQQSPNTLIVTHLTDPTANTAISAAEDRLHDIPLKMQWAADVSTHSIAFIFADPIFSDDFETGDTDEWDGVTP